MDSSHVEIAESSGFAEICVEVDQDPQTFFAVSLTSIDGSAIGKYSKQIPMCPLEVLLLFLLEPLKVLEKCLRYKYEPH